MFKSYFLDYFVNPTLGDNKGIYIHLNISQHEGTNNFQYINTILNNGILLQIYSYT